MVTACQKRNLDVAQDAAQYKDVGERMNKGGNLKPNYLCPRERPSIRTKTQGRGGGAYRNISTKGRP